VAGCGGDDAEAAETLTVYSAQHESLVRTMLEGFTEETGIALEFRDANDAELANQIVQEGEASPADVFLTENSPSIDVLDREGLLAPLDQSTLDQVGAQYRPSSGNWTGFAARSTVLVHNPAQLPQDQLPASILDLANPEWQGRIGIARAARTSRRSWPGSWRCAGRRRPGPGWRGWSATPTCTRATAR
jgi:ABC-type Fe3+ transport system, periplasmic component